METFFTMQYLASMFTHSDMFSQLFLGLKWIVNLLSGYPDTNTSRIFYG